LYDNLRVFVQILYRCRGACLPKSLTLLTQHIEHGFEIWN
jgi:hypothetical protein